MKLLYSPASPFVRKVLVFIKELGLEDKVELIKVSSTVVNQSVELAASNPVATIPTLVMDNGKSLYDSRVITAYLDTLAASPSFYPAEGDARWDVLGMEALSDGLMDAAVNNRYERGLRPAAAGTDAEDADGEGTSAA